MLAQEAVHDSIYLSHARRDVRHGIVRLLRTNTIFSLRGLHLRHVRGANGEIS
jgi:hypothetical protein